MAKILNLFAFVVLTIFSVLVNGSPIVAPAVDAGEFSLLVLHTNDMHAKYYETSKKSSRCKPTLENCYGGFARLATLIGKARAGPTPVLYLDAGDIFSGLWHRVYKEVAAYHFMNILEPNATSLGNHEFDNGIQPVTNYIEKVNFPILAANLDVTEQPEFVGSKLRPSTILTVQGRKIGIVGYVTPTTKDVADTGKVKFNPEIEAIQHEVDELKKQGVNILIALGHSGYEKDKEIAAKVNGIDLVIGGHTNTFLYNGKAPDSEKVEGKYPTVIQPLSGRRVYVVQAYAFTKYLGNMLINFDSNDEIKSITGNPILVDGSIKQDKDVLRELDSWKEEVDRQTGEKVGKTDIDLNGDSKFCRKEECSMGNFITDAFVNWYADFQYALKQNGTSDAQIALICGGCIRASIGKGDITIADVVEVLPWDDPLVTIVIDGKTLRDVLEHSVADIDPHDKDSTNGAFLQYAGIKVTYDYTKARLNRVYEASVRSVDNPTLFKPIEDGASYKVLLPYYTKSGADGYDMLKGVDATKMEPAITTDQVVIDYLKKKLASNEAIGPVDEPRIKFRE